MIASLIPAAGPASAGDFEGRFLGYEVSDTSSQTIELDAPVHQDLDDDFVTVALDLGFSTRFFDTRTTEFWIGSNGFLPMHDRVEPGCCEGQELPSEENPDGLIAGFWTDLDPTAGGEIKFQRFDALELDGLDPQPGLVVEFDEVPGPDGTVSMQFVVLENGVYEVRVHHASVPAGTEMTVGAEAFTGEEGITIEHGDDVTLEDVAYRFTPQYEPKVPDLNVVDVEANPPAQTDPTGSWEVYTTIRNDGLNPVAEGALDLTVTPESGTLRGTSEGCSISADQATLIGLEPGETTERLLVWQPTLPSAGDFSFTVEGEVTKAVKDEQNLENNEATGSASYLVEDRGGTDPYCQQAPSGPSDVTDLLGGIAP